MTVRERLIGSLHGALETLENWNDSDVDSSLGESLVIALTDEDAEVDVTLALHEGEISMPQEADEMKGVYANVRMTTEEAAHMHDALTFYKNAMTAQGTIWPSHTLNARCRTLLEEASK